jgi:tetratricopeptide (TPR) repeat protein
LLGRGNYSTALEHLTTAINSLQLAIDHPEVQGLKSLTLLTARACEYASQAAEKLNDHERCIDLLHKAADILDHTVRHFKVAATRNELLGEAVLYRKKAEKKVKKADSSAVDPSAPFSK